MKPSITCVKTFGLIIALGKSFSALTALAPVVDFDGTEDVLIDFRLVVFVVVVLVVVLILLLTNVVVLVVDAAELVAIVGAELVAVVVPTLADNVVSSDVSDAGVVSIGVTICWGISGSELLFAVVTVPVATEETNVLVVKVASEEEILFASVPTTFDDVSFWLDSLQLEGVLGALKLVVRATVVGVLGALDTALTCSTDTLLGVLGKDAEAVF
uniref:Uncharacterized protein n=1 Tax=Glossina brevipalpis TaxID=37001 RepID=A0A1A9X1F9_9MUSC